MDSDQAPVVNRRKLRLPMWVSGIAFAALIGVLAGRHTLGTTCVVSGSSMLPTLQPGDWIRTEVPSFPLARGDIVVLDDNDHQKAVKRVVGLPGETVCLQRGYVFINGTILLEPYIPRCVYTFPRNQRYLFVLGEDQFFVLGDNRPCSMDSRIYGPVEKKQILGAVPGGPDMLRPTAGPYTIAILADLAQSRHVPKRLPSSGL